MKLTLPFALCATLIAPLIAPLNLVNSAHADTRRTDLNIEADLLEAATNGDSRRVTTLLKQGAKIETRDPQTTWTPLMMAARGGHVATVRVLLERGARVNVRSVGSAKTYMALAQLPTRETRPVTANEEDDDEAMTPVSTSFFLSANNGVTPLMLASVGGWNLASLELLKRGADVNLRSSSGEGALEAACFKGYLPLVKTLIEKGAKVNAKNGRGETALAVAVLNGHAPVVKYLLQQKADPNTPLNNYPMLTVANYYGFTTIARDLKRYGAKTSLPTAKAPAKAAPAKAKPSMSPREKVGAPDASGSGIIILN